jgi:multicomponent Na+:H+ antiporter subunit F
MSPAFTAALALLGIAALLTLARLVRGPSTFDRIMALDVLTVLLVSGIAVHAAARRTDAYVTLLVTVALLGFVSTVTASRLAGRRPR